MGARRSASSQPDRICLRDVRPCAHARLFLQPYLARLPHTSLRRLSDHSTPRHRQWQPAQLEVAHFNRPRCFRVDNLLLDINFLAPLT